MNEIKDCIDALLAAVQNSEEYQEFEKYRDLLKENPELMDRVNAFRGNNFRLQNEANRDELFRGTEQLNRESRELRRDPLVNLCRRYAGHLQRESIWTFLSYKEETWVIQEIRWEKQGFL